MTLLLAGGQDDPNLAVLAHAAQRANVELLDLRLPASESPASAGIPQNAWRALLAKSSRPQRHSFAMTCSEDAGSSS
jgi:hypothetical protein